MSDFDVKEKRFEEDIEDYLTHHGGYTKGDPKKFNRESGLDEDTFVEFIKTSQPKKWERYVKIYAENSEKQIIERFKREVKTTNLLNVMRHGFMDRGIKFYPIFWKPETSLNETTQMQYDANILHCTRQLHYSVHNENSIDIVLFANGIPVVSMELKCQFTGQDTTNAINQYKFDRAGKDAIFAFKERVLVHFAVDLTNVYMTTRLEGAHTYFLPFNQGSNGAGKVGGKGNPVNPNGYDTAYLWERVLCKDSLMEILQKYMHLQQEYDKNGNLVKETMIFPRYHQLDVVTKLLEDVKKNGSGKSYLIQHSAGSGKSNSIAWLAHRLAKVFVNNFNLPESTAIIDLAYGRCRDDNSHWQNVLKYCKDGCFQAMIDEYIHMLKETAGFQSDGNQYQIVHDMMMDSLKIHTATYIADTYPDFKKRINGADRKSDGCRIRSSYAVGFTKDAGDNSKVVMRKENIRNAFNSPMRPFVLATTSIGQEGLDFHNYCRVIMHWNLPSNPIDLEQREGRINRFKCLAIRQNVADKYGKADGITFKRDIWTEMFEAAKAEKQNDQSELVPFWCFGKNQSVKIERLVPMYPMSKDEVNYERLIKILSLYRLTLGQARQEELLEYLFKEFKDTSGLKKLFIDLSPFSKGKEG